MPARRPAALVAWSLAALLLAAAPACSSKKGSAHPPTASNVRLSPTSAGVGDGGGSLALTFSLDVADAGSDITGLTATVTDARGTEVGRATGAIENPPGDTSGSISGSVTVPTTSVAVYTVHLQVADATGATSGDATATFTVVPAPVLTSISPASAEAGSGSLTLTATGSGFTSSSTVLWNGTALTTTFVDAATLQATVPSNVLTSAGTAQVTVSGASPGGGTSSAQSFTITSSPPRPVPVLTSISPASAGAGSGSLTLTATGSDFTGGSTVLWDGVALTTTFVDAAKLQATVPSCFLTSAGTAQVTVSGASPGGGTSGAQVFTITSPPPHPVPALTSISPASAEAGSAGFTLTATGSGFTGSFTVLWNGTALTTTFVDAATLQATVPYYFLTSAGTVQVTVSGSSFVGGTSSAQAFTITSPPPRPVPVLTSISPASAEAGSAGLTLTATGSDFASNSTVLWDGNSLATTFVDAATLQATVPYYYLTSAGTARVTISTPYPGGGTSSTQVFTVTAPPPRPVPVLTAISPSGADAGTTTLTVTVTGSGFSPSSVAQTASYYYFGTTTFVDATTLRVEVPASILATPGSLAVRVHTPPPGGGTSDAVAFAVRVPPQPGVTVLPVTASDVVWDPYQRKLYLSLPSASPQGPNTITALDPETGLLGASQFAGSEPGPLALSDDGQYLYAGLRGASEVVRFALPGLAPDLAIDLGRASADGAYVATDLQVAPGSPRAVAVAMNASYYSTSITVFDDGMPRASSITSGGGSAAIGGLQWGSSAGVLYTASASFGASSGDLGVYTVDAAGLTAARSYKSAFSGGGQPRYDLGTGLLYGREGRAVDPATGQLVGTYSPLGYSYGTMVTDSSLGTAFFAVKGGNSGWLELRSFDLRHFVPTGTTTLSYLAGPATRAVRWGPDGLALLTGSQVILVRGAAVLPVATSPSPAPTVTELAPASIAAGSGNLRLTVRGTGFVLGSLVRVGGADRCTRWVSASELVAYLPASDLATAGALPVTVASPAPGGGNSAELSLTVAP